MVRLEPIVVAGVLVLVVGVVVVEEEEETFRLSWEL
jgi:hypothetical protein